MRKRRNTDYRRTAHLHRKRRRQEEKKRRLLPVILSAIVCAAAALGIGLHMLRAVGRANLRAGAGSAAPVLTQTETPTEEEKRAVAWQDGWVKYDGEIYAYNDEIFTFLIMGIDKTGAVERVADGTNGGQADALFLLVLNPRARRLQILAINRNAMADVDIYNEEGDYVRTVKAQISVQHGFGDGAERSCEYEKRAVEKFLYQLPIHGYAAINMSSVAVINDAVNGVDVTVLEDLTKWERSLQKGADVHLTGETAYIYTTRRDTGTEGSADARLARQKQYLTAFMKKAVARIKENPASVLELYNAVTSEMTTDITADEAAYLAPIAAACDFGSGDIYILEGETTIGSDGFEEFHTDEAALYRLLIGMFYERVETGR